MNNHIKVIKNFGCTVRKVIDGVFVSSDEMYIDNIGKKIANTIVSRYYKGIEADNSNAVLVVYEKI